MTLRIKTPREEFEAAEAGGYVYGELRRQKIFPVYVELGTEEEYIPSSNDNPRTEYRLFKRCKVSVAETEERLDKEKYIFESVDVTVVIYC